MRQSFAFIRKLATKFISPPTPHDRLMLARIDMVDQWAFGFDYAVRERAEPLSLQMRIEDVRSRVLRIDGTKSRELKKLPEGGAAEHGTSFTTAASSVGVKGGDGTQNSGSNHSSGSNGVAKPPEENATTGFGNTSRLARAVPKRGGERDPKSPFSGLLRLRHRWLSILHFHHSPPIDDYLKAETHGKASNQGAEPL
ncbi:hypothetical protein EDB84DRAFT_1564463 [Lactarius hengduanensis]|nr:hypothetical protein EDB84DRAFT_1564463 [Lactarius hengduanensis]